MKKTTLPLTIHNTTSMVPYTIHKTQVRIFAKELLEEGWTIVPATRHNQFVLRDWCVLNVAHDEFGYNTVTRSFIFKDAAVAIHFKFSCL
jgi:hypothetical protein